MKNILATVAIAACLISTGANATPVLNSPLTITPSSKTASTSSFATGTMVNDGFSKNELTFVYGTLTATVPGTVTYTYLGSDAGFNNSFVAANNSVFYNHIFSNHTATTLGTNVTQSVTSGVLNFAFSTQSPSYTVTDAQNIQSSTYGANEGVFGIVSGATVNGNKYQYVLIYNDPLSTGGKDYNDLVVGVNFTAAVPEPETYAMLLAGLGLMGTIARRRKNKQA